MTTFAEPKQSIDPLEDGISCVELLWVVGDDLEVVNDARVSRNVEHNVLHLESDLRIIDYMKRHNHWTPFAGSYAKFRIKMPIYIAREWYRHTVGLNRNEVSRRYVKTEPQYYSPTKIRQAARPGQNKQGVQDAELVPGFLQIAADLDQGMAESVNHYNHLIIQGVAPEQARVVLPQSMYTEFRESGSLAAFVRICSLRISPDAMLECRRYAEAVSDLLAPHFPYSWRNFGDSPE